MIDLFIQALICAPFVWWLSTMLVVTPQQSIRMIETFGKYAGTRQAGLTIKAPFPIQSASRPFSLRLREIAVDVGMKSIDNAFVQVPIRVQFMVDPKRAREAYYLLEDAEGQITSYVINQVRATGGAKTFNELFTSRDAFESDVQELLEERMDEFGYVIRNVLVDDPQPSNELREAFDRVIASERLKEAATNEAEAERIKQVAGAQAEKESMVLRGEAISSFRKTITEGNAEAINSFTADTGLTAADALAFITSINEMEAVGRASEAGGSVVFVAGSAKDKAVDPMIAMLADKSGKASPKEAPSGKATPKDGPSSIDYP